MRWRFGAALLCLVVAFAAAVPGCTTFSGLTAAGPDTSFDGGPPRDSTIVSDLDATESLDAAALDSGLPPDADMPLDASVLAYLSMEDAAKLCASVFKCTNLAFSVQASIDIPLDESNFSACMEWAAGPIPPSRLGFLEQQKQLQCVARAADCVAAGRCLDYEVMDPADRHCADAGSKIFCTDNGGSVDLCPWRVAWHCDNSYYGTSSTCTVSDAGVFTCAAGECQKTQCQGQINYYCGIDGMQYTIDCRVTGHKCGLVPNQSIYDCVTRSGEYLTCDTVQTVCTGDAGTVVQVCDGIYWSEFECADLGGSCDDTANVPRCKRPKDTCRPADADIGTCQGNQVSLCIGGQKTSFDCASVGLKCIPATAALAGRCG
jgi:hypothetical protein